MWILFQVLACAAVVGAQAFNRAYGLCISSWVVYTTLSAVVCWGAFAYSYAKAPSFFAAFFLGSAALNILGLIASLVIFKDVIHLPHVIGALFVIVGGVLVAW